MSRSRLIGPAVGLLALVAVVGAIVWHDPLRPPFQGVDDAWLALMRSTRSPGLTSIARALDLAGGTAVEVVMAVALAAYCLFRRVWGLAAFVLAATIGAKLITDIIKIVVARPRPSGGLIAVGSFSYPSGHVSAATALTIAAMLVIWHLTRRWVGAGIVAVAATSMIWDRTYLGVHWLSDTLAGAVLGLGAALLAWALLRPVLGRVSATPVLPVADAPVPPVVDVETTPDG